MTTVSRVRAQIHAPASCLAAVTATLQSAGIRPSTRAEVAVLVTDRDDPGRADEWSVDSLPHIVVRLDRGSVRVGPFVQPGVTACLRCVAASDPTPPTQPAAYAEVDPALTTIALAWAARDVATWHEGGVPSTWSSSVTLEADLRPSFTEWPRHPHCGCSWGAVFGLG